MTQSQQMSDELLDCYTKTAANIISYYRGDERKNKLKELRDTVEKNCIQEARLKKAEEASKTLLTEYQRNNPDANIEDVIEEYKKILQKIDKVPKKLKATRLEEYDKRVEALMHNKADEEDDEDDDEDNDLRVKGGYVNTIDPISKKTIVYAVKNSVCGHTYDRDTITALLEINKNTRCPVIGCKSTKFVTLADLKADIVTQTYLEKNSA